MYIMDANRQYKTRQGQTQHSDVYILTTCPPINTLRVDEQIVCLLCIVTIKNAGYKVDIYLDKRIQRTKVYDMTNNAIQI